MAVEWPLMVFAASAVNIDGLRGISQSRATSHAHTPPTHHVLQRDRASAAAANRREEASTSRNTLHSCNTGYTSTLDLVV